MFFFFNSSNISVDAVLNVNMENEASFFIIGASNASKIGNSFHVPVFYIPHWGQTQVKQLVKKLHRTNWSKMPTTCILFSPTNSLIKTFSWKDHEDLNDTKTQIITHLHQPQPNIRRTNNFREEERALKYIKDTLDIYNVRIVLMPHLMRNIVPICECKTAFCFYAINQRHLFMNFESRIEKLFPTIKVVKHQRFIKDMYIPILQEVAPRGTVTCRYHVKFYKLFLIQDGVHINPMYFEYVYQYLFTIL